MGSNAHLNTDYRLNNKKKKNENAGKFTKIQKSRVKNAYNE